MKRFMVKRLTSSAIETPVYRTTGILARVAVIAMVTSTRVVRISVCFNTRPITARSFITCMCFTVRLGIPDRTIAIVVRRFRCHVTLSIVFTRMKIVAFIHTVAVLNQTSAGVTYTVG